MQKVREATESWKNIPISFPAISSEDIFEEPLIVEAEVEGYLVRRVYVDEESSVETVRKEIDARKGKPREERRSGCGGGSVGQSIIPKSASDHWWRTVRSVCATADHRTRIECKSFSRSRVLKTENIFNGKKWGGKNEVAEWVKAGIVRPVKYPTYISNPVLVKKGDGTWRMCIDFKNLNSACPEDYYPLPNIDCKVELVMGFKYKCFMDTYKGYHQIQMAEGDEEKTAFYTNQGTHCYTKMPFRLKNAGATYQRLVDSTFPSQIGRNLEAYVDDMVIKSRDKKMLLADISETFDNLKKISMKLNPKKCSFEVEEGKFLAYMVTSEGIRANP
ncbi:reverse transcriptase domain-containing protein [Tanacetum coccineum]